MTGCRWRQLNVAEIQGLQAGAKASISGLLVEIIETQRNAKARTTLIRARPNRSWQKPLWVTEIHDCDIEDNQVVVEVPAP